VSKAPDSVAREAKPLDRRFATFDGLRALAAVLIILHHAGFTSGVSYSSGWGPYLSRMDIGVPIFFVISGFLIYRPFVARQLTDRPAPDTAGFFRRRLLRIFPGYWTAFLLQLALGAIVVAGVVGFFFDFFLAQVYIPDRSITISGITQSWSLATELGFYAMLPAWAWLTARWTRGRTVNGRALVLLVGCAGLVAFSFAFRAVMHVLSPSTLSGWGSVSRYWIPSLIDVFALGMALAVVSVWADHRAMIRDVADRVARPAWAWWIASVVLFVFVSTQLGLVTGLSTAGFARETARQLLYGLVGFCIVVPSALGDTQGGPIRRILAAAPVAYVGAVSYGIYLWHQAFIHWIPEWFDWPPGPTVPADSAKGLFNGHFWPLFLGSFAGSLAVAALSYHLIEQPLMRRFRNGVRRRPTVAPVPAP